MRPSSAINISYGRDLHGSSNGEGIAEIGKIMESSMRFDWSFLDHRTVTSNDRSWSLYIHLAGGMQTGYELRWQAENEGQKVVL